MNITVMPTTRERFDITKQDHLKNLMAPEYYRINFIDNIPNYSVLINLLTNFDPEQPITYMLPFSDTELMANIGSMVKEKEVAPLGGDPFEMKFVTFKPEVKRFNLALRMSFTYEAMNSIVLEEEALKEIYSKFAIAIERAILHGAGQSKGLVNHQGGSKENWSNKIGGGTGTPFDGENIYKSFEAFVKAGYDLQNASIVAGSQAYTYLIRYRMNKDVQFPLTQGYIGNSNYNIFGIPIYHCRALTHNHMLFGDFRTAGIGFRDMSHEFFDNNKGDTILVCNAAFDLMYPHAAQGNHPAIELLTVNV